MHHIPLRIFISNRIMLFSPHNLTVIFTISGEIRSEKKSKIIKINTINIKK